MDKIIYGVIFALAVGIFCRGMNIPAPAPPSLIGALMVFSVSLGYVATDYLVTRNAKLHTQRPNTTRHLSGGHIGVPPEEIASPSAETEEAS